ncbi:MAG: dihydrodipicolinate synthase family protein [Spirochaetales bacterium]|nr:MAG: dihydrodipicolinate synthase family protein [Spirochaetales bacterium]
MISEEHCIKLKGVIAALCTPMREDLSIDFSALEKQTGYLSAAGVQGFFVNGTTAEGPLLSTAEKRDVLAAVRAAAGREKFLCAACIQPSTFQVVREIRELSDLEPEFFVAVSPFYFKADQAAIIRHYDTIAAASPVPVILYNIPQNTHNPLELDTVLALAAAGNIAGIKDSSGNFLNFTRGLLRHPPGFAWIQGEDYLPGASFLMGADALVTGLGNIFIEPYVMMYRALTAGDREGLLRGQHAINRLYSLLEKRPGRNIATIKAAGYLLGRGNLWQRTGQAGLTEDELRLLKDEVSALNT